jgi:dCMP deaminase
MLSSGDPDRRVTALLFDRNDKLIGKRRKRLLKAQLPRDSRERSSRKTGQKYFWIEHAERRVILKALGHGINLDGGAIVVSLFPCSDCARAIIQSGITKVAAPRISSLEERHLQTMTVARDILLASNIAIEYA